MQKPWKQILLPRLQSFIIFSIYFFVEYFLFAFPSILSLNDTLKYTHSVYVHAITYFFRWFNDQLFLNYIPMQMHKLGWGTWNEHEARNCVFKVWFSIHLNVLFPLISILFLLFLNAVDGWNREKKIFFFVLLIFFNFKLEDTIHFQWNNSNFVCSTTFVDWICWTIAKRYFEKCYDLIETFCFKLPLGQMAKVEISFSDQLLLGKQ